ncbi:putative peptidase family-domain-containing protein [Rhypophila decipiens]|uniref:Peptidase family-domain-containing protein n=1 Tax=Rhypophila decipiens TaxID=261697 RepID=A0AAN6XZD3_9PEZI|nr:putative peptidase family-domain-containing protein [Rhypophila decipiens]
MISLTNIQDGEEIYQRCVLVTGRSDDEEANCITISTVDDGGKTIFPDQQWLVSESRDFKALLILAPGNNNITICSNRPESLTLTVRYIPLLQTPPLHLAILIAKDSPLLIDCPPSRFPSLSSTHSSLSAAIAKFRMTALMWQAVTAEDFRLNGLSRRSFRLEEEWTSSSSSCTLSQAHLDNKSSSSPVPRIHLVRTEHTVADLRQADRAQQNPNAKDAGSLHEIFSSALKAHGPPFEGPVTVAGLILDSHFDITQNLIVGHAALGAHDPDGLSLGIFGSHLTYAWPRFIEDVTICLTDKTVPGESVGNDCGECVTMWQACAVGQGAFLHEVGHAFGAPHSSGIMIRGYSPDWVRWFVPGEANAVATNKCRWDVRDLLRFKALEAFALPSDKKMDRAEPVLEIVDEEEEGVRIKCEAGVGVVILNGEIEPVPSLQKPVKEVVLKVAELEKRFDRSKPLELVAVGMNGEEKRKGNVWKFLSKRSRIRVPGTMIRLMKKAVGDVDRADDDDSSWEWAVMLKRRGKNGQLVDASKIDVRVGSWLDGAIVHYRDGTQVPCGPRGRHGDDDPHMGGHQARKIAIRKGVEVVKVGVNAPGGTLEGLRIWLSNGSARGALNCGSNRDSVHVLVPDEGQRIIGFYGASAPGGGCCSQFGIVTAPKDVELPDSVYDMEELQNKPEGQRSRKRRRISGKDDSGSDTEDDADSASTSEDEDEGYDHASDVDDL